jgi:hypothetical protein
MVKIDRTESLPNSTKISYAYTNKKEGVRTC